MNELDERISSIVQKLNSYNNSHPNLTTIWENYLNIRLEKIINTIDDCETLITRIESGANDLSETQIYALYNIYRIMN